MSFPSTRRTVAHYSRRTFTTTCRTLDHYRTLGVTRDASKAQIKSHYYQLSRKHHPDVSSDPRSREIFAKVCEAYTVLINDRDRRAYDKTLQHQQQYHHQHQPGNWTGPAHRWASPTRGPRAKHAWEHTYRPRTGYDGSPNRPWGRSHMGENAPRPAPQPTARGGTNRVERRAEEAAREMDRVRGISGAKRALLLIGMMGLSFAIFGSWRQIV